MTHDLKIKWPVAAWVLPVMAAFTISACSDMPRVPFTQPLHIVKDRSKEAQQAALTAPASDRRDALATSAGPAPPITAGTAQPLASARPPKLEGESISTVYEAIRLPAFINSVFGELLKVPFEIDSAVTQKEQILVTLSTGGSLTPDDFYQLVTEVLGNYGVSVVYSNNVYRIVETVNVKKQIPRIIRSRAVSSVPADMRPIFYFQPVNNIPVTSMQIWMELALKGRVQSTPIPYANGLLLLGSAEDVEATLETMKILDQPYLAGSTSLKISPAFWSAPKLAQQLVDILGAEGYSIAIGGQNSSAIKLIPIESLNVIIAFGTGQEALQHVLKWAQELDQPAQTTGAEGVFYHQVYNAKAKDLSDIVGTILDEAIAPAAADMQKGVTAASQSRKKVTVDEARNALIFVGSAEEYGQFRSLMTQMDRAPLEVMIEATIAEVTLKQGENLGLVFDYDDGRTTAPDRTLVKADAAGLFFSMIRDRASLTARLNALADYSRLQILSTPRVVTSSGKTAAINVGTQVPIITTQEASPTGSVGGTSTILQSIQYRNTGVILNISPTINSSRRVEITVSQEVSAAQENNVSGVQSPLIATRSLQTTLSMDDGETVLLGGLISENYSTGNSGVPYLKDLPWIGYLFKNQSQSVNTTELIILLTPYIIDGPETSRQIRDAFQSKLGDWAKPIEPPAPVSAPMPPTEP
jgi:general secretion pathway protein D